MRFRILLSSLFLLWNIISPDTRLVDRILAVVENEIITLSDAAKAATLFPWTKSPSTSEDAFQARILENLINYKVVYREFQREFQLTDEDFEEIQLKMIEKAGSMEKLSNILKNLGMDWRSLKDFVRERVVYTKVLSEKVFTKITISFEEIEKFYKEEYLPAQHRLQLTAKTLIEMTPSIEKHLRRQKTEARLQEWLDEIRSGYQIKYPSLEPEREVNPTEDGKIGE